MKKTGIFFVLVAGLTLVLPRTLMQLYGEPQSTARISFSVHPPERRTVLSVGDDAGPVAVSPDGRHLAFVATSEKEQLLWVRRLDTLDARALPGTEGATYPFWSPDSRFIAFFAEGKLKKIEASGGTPQILCDVGGGTRGGTWNRQGVILSGGFGPLFSVSDTSGALTPVTTLERGQVNHRWPHFLPDGRHFVYFAVHNQYDRNAIYLGSLDSRDSKRLMNADSHAVYESGHLLYVRQGILVAQPFDTNDLRLKKTTFLVAEGVGSDLNTSHGVFSTSEKVLAYSHSARSIMRRFGWFDREGKELGFIEPPEHYRSPSLSPDETKIAFEHRDPGTGLDIWLFDLSLGVRSQVTSDASEQWYPLWSPDGSQIIFSSNREGRFKLYQKPSDGAGEEELLSTSSTRMYQADWSRDGRFVLYESYDRETRSDLWVLPMFGDQKPFPLLQTEFNEREGRLSSDGHWVAYVSNESGRNEVYVQSFPKPGGKKRISTEGGSEPEWRGDGKELFYLTPDGMLMAVEVKADSTLEVSIPKSLFQTGARGLAGTKYDVSGDGQRFLVNTELLLTSSPINVIVNWTEGLRKWDPPAVPPIDEFQP